MNGDSSWCFGLNGFRFTSVCCWDSQLGISNGNDMFVLYNAVSACTEFGQYVAKTCEAVIRMLSVAIASTCFVYLVILEEKVLCWTVGLRARIKFMPNRSHHFRPPGLDIPNIHSLMPILWLEIDLCMILMLTQVRASTLGVESCCEMFMRCLLESCALGLVSWNVYCKRVQQAIA